MLTSPAAILAITAGMKKGEILRGPPASRFECSRSMISKPPIPEPIKTPTRSSFSGVIWRPDWAIASCVAAKAKWIEAPHLARFLLVHKIERVEVLHFGGKRDRETSSIEALNGPHAAGSGQQLLPNLGRGVAHTADQPQAGDDDAASHWLFAAFRILLDVLNGVLDGLDLLGCLVGNLDVKRLFELQ